MAAKLTNPMQAALALIRLAGGGMDVKAHTPEMRTHLALVGRGLLDVEPNVPEIGWSRFTLKGNAAPAQPADAITDAAQPAAEAWTPSVGDDFTTTRVHRELRTREAMIPAIESIEQYGEEIEVAFANPLTESQERDLVGLFATPRVLVDFQRGVRGYMVLRRVDAASADAQTAGDDVVTVANIQSVLDEIEWTEATDGRRIVPRVEQLSDGIGCEWFHADDDTWVDFELLGRTLETAMSKAREMVKPPDAHPDPRDAELTRLRAAVAALTRERDALRAALPKFRIGETVQVGEYTPAIGKVEEITITEEGTDYRVYVEGESMAYTWSENRIRAVETQADAPAVTEDAGQGDDLQADMASMANEADEPDFFAEGGDTCPHCGSTRTERMTAICNDPRIEVCHCASCGQDFEVLVEEV